MTPTRSTAAAVAVAWMLLAPGTTQAQDGFAACDRAMAITSEARDAYREARLEAAIELLDQAFGLCPHPVILFNRGRAHQDHGDLRQAQSDYRRYLELRSDAPDRAEVERRLAAVEDAIRQEDEAAARTAAAADAAERAAADAESARQAAADAASRSDPAPWILGAGGLLVLGVAGGFGIAAVVGADVSSGLNHLAASRADQEVQTYALIANVGFGTGAALVLAGAIWGIVLLSSGGASSPTEGVQVALGLDGVRVWGRF